MLLPQNARFTQFWSLSGWTNTASVPNGCITGGRDSKEEIARRNADKPVVSASKGIYIHYESYVAIYRRFSVQHDYLYVLYRVKSGIVSIATIMSTHPAG